MARQRARLIAIRNITSPQLFLRAEIVSANRKYVVSGQRLVNLDIQF